MSWEDDWLEAAYEDTNGGDVDTGVEDEDEDEDDTDIPSAIAPNDSTWSG